MPSAIRRRLKVVRLDLPLDSSFDALLAEAADIDAEICLARGDDGATWRALAQANVYHVSSAKDELPRHWFVTAALLERARDLLCVSTYGAGYDTVDIDACTLAGVCVVNQAGSNANAVAEHTLGLLLGLSKRIAECDRRLRRGERFARQAVIGEELDGRTIGLVGIGHIGRRVAKLARAFGMTVVASDPLLPAAEIERRGATPLNLDGLLREADVVSVHCPLDASTRGLFGRVAFAAMKPGALFLSTARGGIHDERALFDALASGHLGGAGLDVWSIEPPPGDHPLLSLDNVFATYHIAGVTHGARRGMARLAVRQILDIATGTRPRNLVNPSVIAAFADRYKRVLGRPLPWAPEAE